VSQLPAFQLAAEDYWRAGWPAILPVPHRGKTPPPEGFTGDEGRDTTWADISAWASNGMAYHSVALRMPDGLIGIDVDHYDKVSKTGHLVEKRGGDTLAQCVQQWGPLPPTWSSTARGAGPSRIMFYRVPGGRYRTVIEPHIEIIQRHHRYSVVWPSIHEETGTQYQWYDPDGNLATRPPGPYDFPELPPAWVQGLRDGASEAGPLSADRASGELLLARLSQDERDACPVLGDAIHKARVELETCDPGSRHDAVTPRVHHFVMVAAHGHAGFGPAVQHLRERWAELTAGEGRESEFERMLTTSARKAWTLTGGAELPDPCEGLGGALWQGVSVVGGQTDSRPRPVDNRPPDEEGTPPEPLVQTLPPKPADPAWGQIIGALPFDPGVDLDQLLADHMLVRTVEMVRRAADTKSAWIQRGAEQWTVEDTDIPRRIVAECARLMPAGNAQKPADGEDPTEYQRFKRKQRMMMNGPAAGVANMIKAVTAGGRHPATINLRDLDTDREILWAGGWPWDLRGSLTEPAAAYHIDPLRTPHLAAAGVTPLAVETPRWDAFLAAVWPDPAVRAWCLRVLSIAVTGYPDAALPILFGPGGTGKTSLVSLLMELLGTYAHAANPKLLGADADQFMTYTLKGRRLSFIDEAMREGTRNAETLKQLTGGGMLTGAQKYQGEITFPATHTLVLTSNTEPNVHDEAIRRRIRLLPCDGDPAEVRARRQELNATWAHEAPGALAMLMREAAAWLAEPDTALTAAAPLQIQTQLGELVQSQDLPTQWLEDATRPDDYGTKSRQLYIWFRGWCKEIGVRDNLIPSDKSWSKTLTDRGYPVLHRENGNYRALALRGEGGFVPPPPVTVTQTTQPQSYPQAPSTPVDNFSGLGHTPEGSLKAPEGNLKANFEHPSGPVDPSSGPVFDPSLKPLKDPATPLRDINGSNHNQGERLGNASDPSGTRGENSGSPAKTAPEGCALGTFETASETNRDETDTVVHSDQPLALPFALDLSRDVTKGEVAQAADALGVTKTEVRKLIKAETRRLKILEAAGGVYTLPVAVDREGVITEIGSTEALTRVCAAVERSGALTVDVEHNGYPLGHRFYELRLVQLGDDLDCVIFHPHDHADLIANLLGRDWALFAHSGTADLCPLADAKLVDFESALARLHDTVIPAKLADPASTGADPSLKKISPALLGERSTVERADAGRRALVKAGGWLLNTETDTPPERNSWHQIQRNWGTFLRYAASDVLDTAVIPKILAPQLPPTHIYERERLAQRLTARVAFRGVPLDYGRIRELSAEHTGLQQASRARLAQLAPDIDNPGSNAQVSAALEARGVVLPRTDPSAKFPPGQPSVAEGTLEPLADEGGPVAELARELLVYREHSTALGTFIRPYAALCEMGDGRARPTVYTLGTNTGRMSCVRPNAQQLPRAGGFRSMYVCDPGYLMLSADFSSVELRVAAALSGDQKLTELIMTGGDLHAEIALMVFNDPDPVASAERGRPWPKQAHRYKVKGGVFGRIYGGNAPTLASQMGVRLHVAERMVEALDAFLPQLAAWSEWLRQEIRRGRMPVFETYSGRQIHIQRQFPHKGPNYAIQGTAREALVDALVKWNQTKWAKCTLLPVHDELDVWVPADQAEEASRVLQECMTSEINGVPIVAKLDPPSPFWADAE
jgi:P4 family phage/plasmid primase-like protien